MAQPRFHPIKEETPRVEIIPRYRLPSEDDDAFAPEPHPCTTLSSTTSSGNRGIKRSRLSSDDDVFFRPRARLASDSTPQFPRSRLPSESDCSSVFYPRHRRFRGRENRPLLQPPQDTSSIQLSSSQYTADDTPDPAFKTPYSRPPRRRSSEVSSLQPNSSRDTSCLFKQPPKVTRTPLAWISPNISDISQAVSMSDESIADVRLRLFHQISSRSSVSDISFSLQDYIGQTSVPTTIPTTSSPREADITPPNLAQSILAEELRSDSGISTLSSFDGQECFNDYRKDFGEKLVDVMVKILNKVDPPISSIPDQHQPVCYTISDWVPDASFLDVSGIFSPPMETDSSPGPCFESPPEVFVYCPQTPAPSPTDVAASSDLSSLDDAHSAGSCLNSYPEDFPAPTPAPSPTYVSSSPNLSSLLTISPPDVSHPLMIGPSSHTTIQQASDSATTSTKKSTTCKVCHKTFSSPYNLRVHTRIHTGERPYVCPFCFKDFSDPTTFRRHKVLHTGKPFACELCNRAFVTRSQLKRHITRHR